MYRLPVSPGIDDRDQLHKIFQLVGSPTEDTWPGITRLPGYNEYSTYKTPKPLSHVVHTLSSEGIDLLHKHLQSNPSRRCSAEEALSHIYFSS